MQKQTKPLTAKMTEIQINIHENMQLNITELLIKSIESACKDIVNNAILFCANKYQFDYYEAINTLNTNKIHIKTKKMIRGPAKNQGAALPEPLAQKEKVPKTKKTKKSAAQDPAAQDPAAQEPAAQEPAAQEPAAQEPAAQEPAAKKTRGRPKKTPTTVANNDIFAEEHATRVNTDLPMNNNASNDTDADETKNIAKKSKLSDEEKAAKKALFEEQKKKEKEAKEQQKKLDKEAKEQQKKLDKEAKKLQKKNSKSDDQDEQVDQVDHVDHVENVVEKDLTKNIMIDGVKHICNMKTNNVYLEGKLVGKYDPHEKSIELFDDEDESDDEEFDI